MVGLTSHGPAVIQTRKPIRKLADLKGMKIRIPSPIANTIAKSYGATGIKAPAPKVYEYLSSGIADGVFHAGRDPEELPPQGSDQERRDHAGRPLLW